MKIFKNFGLLFVMTGFLAACQSDESENNDEVLSEDTNAEVSEENNDTEADINSEEETEESSDEEAEQQEIDDKTLDSIAKETDELESYKAQLDITAALDEMESRDLNAEVFYVNSEPPEMLLRSAGEDRMVTKDGLIYYNNGASWIDLTDSVDAELLYSVTYDEAVHSIVEMAPHMEEEKSDGKIIYTYSGDNAEIYQSIESLVQVDFGVMQIESVNSNVEVVVDEAQHLVEEISFAADGSDAGGTFELEGTATFTDFNNVDEIQLPELTEE